MEWGSDLVCFLYMTLVALQVGVQPVVIRMCVRPTVRSQSLVVADMVASMLLGALLTPWAAFGEWSVNESLVLAGPPAATYALRSLFKQVAYRQCDSVTFNTINQTKVVFCAFAAWLILSEPQTLQQCIALCLAIVAGVLLVLPGNSVHGFSPRVGEPSTANCSAGATLALATAACSGLGAALSQMAMRRSPRPSSLFNFELALWGLLPAVFAGKDMSVKQLMDGWQMLTIVPVLLQSMGGLLVSAIIQQRGGVAMGLCTVAGIGVSVLADAWMLRRPPTARQLFAALLAMCSIAAHQQTSTQIAKVPAVVHWHSGMEAPPLNTTA